MTGNAQNTVIMLIMYSEKRSACSLSDSQIAEDIVMKWVKK